MKFSFSTLACPDWTWQDIIANGTRYGYDGVEVRLLEQETDLLQRPEFQRSRLPARRRELADAGFRISGLASSVHFDEPDAAQRTTQLQTGRAYLDLARELGAEFIRVFGDVVPPKDDPQRETAMHHIADGLQSLGEYAEPLGMQVVIETHGDYSGSQLVAQTLQLVESDAVGVLWDTHHPWRFLAEPLDETFARIGNWVNLDTHWKDSVSQLRRAGSTTDEAASKAHALMTGHRHADYVLFGGGEFPIADCLRLLQNSDYAGWFCYEWEKAWHPEIEDPEVALPLFPEKMRRMAELVTNGTR